MAASALVIDKTFAEQRRHDPPTRCAERAAQGDVAAAAGAFGEHQTGDVAATDQQQDADRREQESERAPRLAGEVGLQRRQGDRPAGVGARKETAQIGLDGVEVGARLLGGNAVAEAADRLVEPEGAGGRHRRRQLRRQPHVDVRRRISE
jgi:hypothetical protein